MSEPNENFRETAERLRLATDGAGVGTYELNLSTGLGVWSAAAFGLLGLKPTADYHGNFEQWRDALHPDDRDEVLAAHMEAASKGKSWRKIHRVIRKDNGETRWLSVFGHFSRRGDDVISTGAVMDVTDQRKAENDRRESEARLRALTDNLPGGLVFQIATTGGSGTSFPLRIAKP